MSEIKSSFFPSHLITRKESDFELILIRDSFPTGMILTSHPSFEVSSSNPDFLLSRREGLVRCTLIPRHSSIFPPPLLDSDSLSLWSCMVSVTLNSLGNEDKVFKPVAGDGVTGIKRRRRDQSSDNIRNLATESRRGRLKEDLESSTWRRRTDKTNITRKPSKTGKHEHGNQKSTKEAMDLKPKPRKVNYGQASVKESQTWSTEVNH
ncbi:hypothetical protein Tco_0213723 [Tanacetum coccineum]